MKELFVHNERGAGTEAQKDSTVCRRVVFSCLEEAVPVGF